MASRSASVAILEVACRVSAQPSSSAVMPDAVVAHADELAAGIAEIHRDLGGLRIQRVLHQLLHHGRRALHHLAGGDLVHEVLGEQLDPAHAGRSRIKRCHSARRLSAASGVNVPMSSAARSLRMGSPPAGRDRAGPVRVRARRTKAACRLRSAPPARSPARREWPWRGPPPPRATPPAAPPGSRRSGRCRRAAPCGGR